MLHQYLIRKIRFKHPVFTEIDFKDYTAMMFVKSLVSADLVVTKPEKIFAGVFKLPRLIPYSSPFPLLVTSIEYTIQAIDKPNMYEKSFRHNFYGNVNLNKEMELRSLDGRLFKQYDLDFLVESSCFHDVKGLQFIA